MVDAEWRIMVGGRAYLWYGRVFSIIVCWDQWLRFVMYVAEISKAVMLGTEVHSRLVADLLSRSLNHCSRREISHAGVVGRREEGREERGNRWRGGGERDERWKERGREIGEVEGER